MFWSDWGLKPRIEMAFMDGNERKILVDKNILWPAGLAIDYPAKRLYWTDPKALTIESITLFGKDRQKVHHFKQGICYLSICLHWTHI